ncbi:hypothetical protein [Clostridium baratii]|uniref:hypothetical protein n=1 Tax=Clostridium baratii TaxID=1561 RepID=UPI003D356CC5
MDKLNKKVYKRYIWIITIILAIIITGIVVGKSQKEKNYQRKITKTYEDMLGLGADSEKIVNNYISLWDGKINFTTKDWTRDYMARWIGIDVNNFKSNTTPFTFRDEALNFNDVLKCYKEYNINTGVNKNLVDRIKQAEIDITELNNPPNKFKKSYEALVNMYTNLNTYVNLAINPSGSLISYKNETSNLSNNIINQYNIVKTQMPN